MTTHNPADCPRCGAATRVIETRRAQTYLRRQRECPNCRWRGSTIECGGESARIAMQLHAGEAASMLCALAPTERQRLREVILRLVDYLLPLAHTLRADESIVASAAADNACDPVGEDSPKHTICALDTSADDML